MIPRIHRWRVPFEDAAPPRSTPHSPLPHHQADPACEPQFLVNLRILLARNVRCAYKCVVLPDLAIEILTMIFVVSQCTYRCAVLPDTGSGDVIAIDQIPSQCTYRCAVLPDTGLRKDVVRLRKGLNAPTGARCSLTPPMFIFDIAFHLSQCTYRCVVLPDPR